MGQRPLTFVRQLLSATCNPSQLLVGDGGGYPSDVRERARGILDNCAGNSIGKSRRRPGQGREGSKEERRENEQEHIREVFKGGSLSPVPFEAVSGCGLLQALSTHPPQYN